MKEKICLILCAMILGISGCGSSDNGSDASDINKEQNQTASYNKEQNLPTAYKSILNNIVDLIVERDPDDNYAEGELTIMETMIGKSASEGLSSIGYAMIDIDGNGVEELIIAEKSEDEIGDRILDIYTIKNDQAILIVEGFVRDRYYLLEDNSIYNEGSGGAAYTMFGVYELPKDEVNLSVKDYYFSGYKDEEMTEWGWFHGQNDQSDTSQSEWVEFQEEDEPFHMMSDYLDRTQKLDLTYLKDYESDDEGNTK